MNTKQANVVSTISNQKWVEWKTGKDIAGILSFSVIEIGDKVLVQASNAGSTEWFQKYFFAQFTVGPKGGLNKITIY